MDEKYQNSQFTPRSGLRSSIPAQQTGTLRAAQSVLGQENPYKILGDNLETILSDGWSLAEKAGLEDSGGTYLRSPAFLTIILILQMIEGLTDEQAANAVRERIDWKYALHLPVVNSGIDARALCQFRREVIHNPAMHRIFEAVLERFPHQSYARIFPAGLESNQIRESVCRQTRLHWIVTAMTEAVDYLAFICPDWMRQHGLPHWHNRYNRDLSRPGAWQQVGWEENMQAVAWDVAYLLQAIEQDPVMGSEPAQVKRLRAVIDQQFLSDANARTGLAAPAPLCSFCQLNR
ncbi:MAG TPA: transposase [Anaerolinea sp.]|nr:transposase [Anaerolinea sp.]